MKVLITGATGMVGQVVVRRLLADGHEVVALARDPASARRLLQARGHQKPEIAALQRDPTALAEAMEGCDGVLHLAGASVAGRRWTKEVKAVL